MACHRWNVVTLLPLTLSLYPEYDSNPDTDPNRQCYFFSIYVNPPVISGCDLDGINNPIVPPISLSTTFAQSFPGVKPGIDDPNSHGLGYFYSRQGNPTRGALERALAKLEHGKHACTFASGLAASNAGS